MEDSPNLAFGKGVLPNESPLATDPPRVNSLPANNRIKKTGRRHTAAEKLRIISYYRKAEELHTDTNKMKPIPIERAASKSNN
jgi:hypothetical protein